MIVKYDAEARRVMQQANQAMKKAGRKYLQSTDILRSILERESNFIAELLKRQQVTAEMCIRFIEDYLAVHGPCTKTETECINSTNRILECAHRSAGEWNKHFITLMDLVIGMLEEEGNAAAVILLDIGITLDDSKEVAIAFRKQEACPVES